VYYLHSYGIVHRDLKLENVMMTNDDDTESIPKLVDFGLAGIKGPNSKFKDAVGTVSYAAPEVLKGHSYDKSIDVWSLGIIIYVMLIGYLPFDNEDK
jgi:serine/threonine protein kinase